MRETGSVSSVISFCEGRADQVFGDAPLLRTAGLRQPTTLEICHEIERRGLADRNNAPIYVPELVDALRDFLLSSGNWVLENHREHRGHRENSNSLCPPCPLWLIFFAIIRVHPEKIKKSLR